MSLGGGSLGVVIADGLIRGRCDVSICFLAVHHRIRNPLRAILPFVAIPLVLRFQIRFAVWREALDLLFREVYLKIVIMFRRAVQAFRGNDESPAAQPAAGV